MESLICGVRFGEIPQQPLENPFDAQCSCESSSMKETSKQQSQNRLGEEQLIQIRKSFFTANTIMLQRHVYLVHQLKLCLHSYYDSDVVHTAHYFTGFLYDGLALCIFCSKRTHPPSNCLHRHQYQNLLSFCVCWYDLICSIM